MHKRTEKYFATGATAFLAHPALTGSVPVAIPFPEKTRIRINRIYSYLTMVDGGALQWLCDKFKIISPPIENNYATFVNGGAAELTVQSGLILDVDFVLNVPAAPAFSCRAYENSFPSPYIAGCFIKFDITVEYEIIP